jgi:hypothetical protein
MSNPKFWLLVAVLFLAPHLSGDGAQTLAGIAAFIAFIALFCD